MSKKKGGKRLSRKALEERLQTLFQQNPNETFTFKQIFRELKLDTHPAKMMAIDLMEEMAWEARSSARPTARTRLCPTMAASQSSSRSVTRCSR